MMGDNGLTAMQAADVIKRILTPSKKLNDVEEDPLLQIAYQVALRLRPCASSNKLQTLRKRSKKQRAKDK